MLNESAMASATRRRGRSPPASPALPASGTDRASVARVHRMPPKKSAAKNKKPAKFVFEFADLALIGQPVRKEFEGVPPTPQPTAAHCAHAPGLARQGTASSRGG